MARGRVGPLGELRIVAAQIDGSRRRHDDLTTRRRALVREAAGAGQPVDLIARAARLDPAEIEALLATD